GVPALVAIIFILIGEDAEYHWDYWRRVIDPTLISPADYRLVFLLPIIITCLSIIISFIFGQSLTQFHLIPQLRAHLPSILVFIVYTFFIGPFPEELGWRGYWLDKLKEHLSGLRASLLIGLVWALWQIPLFMVKGYPLQEKVVEPPLVVFYFLEIFPISVILTYIFYKNKRSTLAAILFHFMVNLAGQVFELSPLTAGIQTFLYVLVAFYLVGKNKAIFK
ncbi:MAG: CPBP family intramembrane glutamic endopeptidase, partial [Candidatus Saccharicenans sp.]